MNKEKALETLKATDVFTESELEIIMKVASPDAIEDMKVLCSNQNFLRYIKEKHLQKRREEFFFKGYFGHYSHDEELTKDPVALGWDRLRDARSYQEVGHIKSFDGFLKSRVNSADLAA